MSNRKVQVSIVVGLFLFLMGMICQSYYFFSRDNWTWIYPYIDFVIPLITFGFILIITGITLSNVKYIPINPENEKNVKLIE